MRPADELARSKELRKQLKNHSLSTILLAVIVMSILIHPNLACDMKVKEETRVEITKIQLQNIVQVLKEFKTRTGSYPSTEQGLQQLVKEGIIKNYPKDGWKRDFVYTLESSGKYTLKSYGADGVPGGEGIDKDISAE